MQTFDSIDNFKKNVKFGEDVLDRYHQVYDDMYEANAEQRMGVIGALLVDGPQLERSVQILFNAISPGSDSHEIRSLLDRGAGRTRQRRFWTQLSDGRYELLSFYRSR